MQNLIIVPHARISAGSFFTNTHFRSLSMGPLIHIGIRKGTLIEQQDRLIDIYEAEIFINGITGLLYLSENTKFPVKDSELGAEILSNITLTADLLMGIIKETERRTKDTIISAIKSSLNGVK